MPSSKDNLKALPKKKYRRSMRLPQALAIGGLLLLIAAVLLLKPGSQAAEPSANSGESAQMQLDRALQEQQPTLAFFHSDNCQQCIDMMQIVAQVYPEFTDSVTLVDINVYDPANETLLKRVGLQYIPTLIFYDRSGKDQVSVGVMEAEQLRQTLAALAGGD